MMKKVIGVVMGLVTLVAVSKLVTVIVVVVGAATFGNSENATADVSAAGNIIGLLFGVWLAVKVWKYFAKEKKPATSGLT
jgi:membrane associated rhomboid family serine protease